MRCKGSFCFDVDQISSSTFIKRILCISARDTRQCTFVAIIRVVAIEISIGGPFMQFHLVSSEIYRFIYMFFTCESLLCCTVSRFFLSFLFFRETRSRVCPTRRFIFSRLLTSRSLFSLPWIYLYLTPRFVFSLAHSLHNILFSSYFLRAVMKMAVLTATESKITIELINFYY